jgi:hypothetical protein
MVLHLTQNSATTYSLKPETYNLKLKTRPKPKAPDPKNEK